MRIIHQNETLKRCPNSVVVQIADCELLPKIFYLKRRRQKKAGVGGRRPSFLSEKFFFKLRIFLFHLRHSFSGNILSTAVFDERRHLPIHRRPLFVSLCWLNSCFVEKLLGVQSTCCADLFQSVWNLIWQCDASQRIPTSVSRRSNVFHMNNPSESIISTRIFHLRIRRM